MKEFGLYAVAFAVGILPGLFFGTVYTDSAQGPVNVSIEPVDSGEMGDYNVVLVSVDPLRTDHLPCYGYQRNTAPNICGLADSGYLFENAYSTSTWTLPAYTSLFTGEYPSEHGFYPRNMTPFNSTEPLLAQRFNSTGYETAAFVGSVPWADIGHLRKGYNLDEGFQTYQAKTLNMRTSMPPALDWLPGHREERFFLFIHAQDSHAPYYPTMDRFRGEYTANYTGVLRNYSLDRGESPRKVLDSIVRRNGTNYLETGNRSIKLSREDMAYIRGRYDETIRTADYYVGRLMERLERENLKDETVVVFTSAHGKLLGEEELNGKVFFGQGLLDRRISRIPMIIRVPDKSGTTRVEGIVQLFDIRPTVLEYAGINSTAEDNSAVSLLPLMRGGDGRDYAVTENEPAPGISVHTRDWRYVSIGGRLRLFNLSSPFEEVSRKHPGTVERLESLIEEWRIRIHE